MLGSQFRSCGGGTARKKAPAQPPKSTTPSQKILLERIKLFFFGGGGGILEKTSWRVPNLSQEDGWHESQESRDGCQEILNTRHIKTSVEAHVYLLQPPSLGACSHPS